MIKKKIKELKSNLCESDMYLFYGKEPSENEKKAYQIGALSALDALDFFVTRLEIHNEYK